MMTELFWKLRYVPLPSPRHRIRVAEVDQTRDLILAFSLLVKGQLSRARVVMPWLITVEMSRSSDITGESGEGEGAGSV